MGGNSSKIIMEAPSLGKTEEEIVRLMMPVYYNPDPLTDEEMTLASDTWKMILSNTSENFIERKQDERFPHPTCIMWFYSSFYERLFDVHPVARALFRDVTSQGKFLVKMISLSLSEKADPVKYENTLIRLAEVHNERGIKAVEYGIVGEVLFWAIRYCVGLTVYTSQVHSSWIKIYSRMLRSMVPVAVAYELRDGSAQAKRFIGNSIGLSGLEESVLTSTGQMKDQAPMYGAARVEY